MFRPGTDEPLVIAPGTTVNFVWESDNHNIVVDEQPEDANWDGHEPIENTGFEYSHTFDVEGQYHYYCAPHRSLGMTADIEVTEGGGGGESDTGEARPTLPRSAETAAIAALAALSATLALTYVFAKYGGDYERID